MFRFLGGDTGAHTFNAEGEKHRNPRREDDDNATLEAVSPNGSLKPGGAREHTTGVLADRLRYCM